MYLLPADSDPCADFVTLYFFNARLNRCQNFTFGGCAGNGNRFTTLAQCEASRCLDPGACHQCFTAATLPGLSVDTLVSLHLVGGCDFGSCGGDWWRLR